jgi:hypothetical protein
MTAPIIENNYTGDGSTVLFSFTFEYIEATDIEVSVDSVTVATTAYSLANATTVEFVTAPAVGAAIRIYRNTTVTTPKAEFFPGSAIRAQDLNDNFEQILFVTQEADAISERAEAAADAAEIATAAAQASAASATAAGAAAQASAAAAATDAASAQADAAQAATDAAAANTTANAANATANTANTNATQAAADAAAAASSASAAATSASSATTAATNAQTSASNALAQASQAATDASSAQTSATNAAASAVVATNNAATANTNANTAVATANTAASDATTAVNTANNAVSTAQTASNTATTASNDASTAITTANSAVSTANSASTTANSAVTTAQGAVTTANTANTAAGNAVTTANSALTTANTASTAASNAVATANAAAAAVSDAYLFTVVANVAAIPSNPSDEDAVRVANSTGIESSSVVQGVPSGFTGDSGINVEIIYNSTASKWDYIAYNANDPDDRYGYPPYVDVTRQNTVDAAALSGVALNSTHLGTFTGSTIADSSTVKAALQSLESEVESKADLVNGVVPTSQLPALAITTFLGTVANQTAMLALSGQRGDFAIRSDTSTTFVLVSDGGSNLSDWQELETPNIPIQSVNGQTGTVVLGPSDVGALSTGGGTLTGNVRANDNVKFTAGSSDDLQIYHDSSNSWIDDAGTGSLKIRSQAGSVQILGTGSNENMAVFTPNGAAELYHNSSQKLATTSNGIDVTGTVQCDQLDVDGTIDISGNASFFGNVSLADNDRLQIGSGSDLEIYHNGSHSFADNATGDFFIRNNANDKDISLQTDNGSGGLATYVKCDGSNGQVILNHLGNTKLFTKSDGVDVTGEVQCDSLDVDGGADINGQLDVNRIVVRDNGASSPTFAIRTDDASPWGFVLGNDAYSTSHEHGLRIFQGSGGDLHIRNSGDNAWETISIAQQNGGSNTEVGVHLDANRAVSLRHQGNDKLATKSDGVNIIGELECDSLDVDGIGDFSSDVTFRGGTGAITITANGDIRATTGTWTGEPGSNTGKLQYHGNAWYLTAHNSWIFRNGSGTDVFKIDNAGKTTAHGNIRAHNASTPTKGAELDTNGALELFRDDHIPFIDFKSTTAEDYDCRIQSTGSGLMFHTGGNGAAGEKWRIRGNGSLSSVGGGGTYRIHMAGGTPGASNSGIAANWATHSDYRLKENVSNISGAIETVKALRPVNFNWIEDETDAVVQGFIAHELQEQVSNAVIGEKDAVLWNGDIDAQSADYSKVVPVLTAALKDAIAKIETLEAKVAALEAS